MWSTDRRRAELCAGIMDSSLILGLLCAAVFDPLVQELLNRGDVELDLLSPRWTRGRRRLALDHHTFASVWRQDDRDGFRVQVRPQRIMHPTSIFACVQDAEAERKQPTVDVEREQIGFVEGAGR